MITGIINSFHIVWMISVMVVSGFTLSNGVIFMAGFILGAVLVGGYIVYAFLACAHIAGKALFD